MKIVKIVWVMSSVLLVAICSFLCAEDVWMTHSTNALWVAIPYYCLSLANCIFSVVVSYKSFNPSNNVDSLNFIDTFNSSYTMDKMSGGQKIIFAISNVFSMLSMSLVWPIVVTYSVFEGLSGGETYAVVKRVGLKSSLLFLPLVLSMIVSVFSTLLFLTTALHITGSLLPYWINILCYLVCFQISILVFTPLPAQLKRTKLNPYVTYLVLLFNTIYLSTLALTSLNPHGASSIIETITMLFSAKTLAGNAFHSHQIDLVKVFAIAIGGLFSFGLLGFLLKFGDFRRNSTDYCFVAAPLMVMGEFEQAKSWLDKAVERTESVCLCQSLCCFGLENFVDGRSWLNRYAAITEHNPEKQGSMEFRLFASSLSLTLTPNATVELIRIALESVTTEIEALEIISAAIKTCKYYLFSKIEPLIEDRWPRIVQYVGVMESDSIKKAQEIVVDLGEYKSGDPVLRMMLISLGIGLEHFGIHGTSAIQVFCEEFPDNVKGDLELLNGFEKCVYASNMGVALAQLENVRPDMMPELRKIRISLSDFTADKRIHEHLQQTYIEGSKGIRLT